MRQSYCVGGAFSVSCPRQSMVAQPPNLFDALLSLKTIVPEHLDHIKENKGYILMGISQWVYPKVKCTYWERVAVMPPELTPVYSIHLVENLYT